LSARYDFLLGQATGSWTPLTTQVYLVADNQTQHLYGDPFWMRSDIALNFARTAVRPLQLDLYGQDLLRWVLEYDDRSKGGLGAPIVHLGDGLNFSCQVELDRFFGHMKEAKVPWAMAPGNHDGYFFGNEASNSEWTRACARGGNPVNHAAFIQRYLKELSAQYSLPPMSTTAGIWQRPEPAPGSAPTPTFLAGVAWSIDVANHFRSYVVQLVDLTLRNGSKPSTPVYALLLDTSEFDQPPVLIKNKTAVDAGQNGSVLQNQIDAARLLLQTRSPAGGQKPFVVVMGHHPFGVLTPASQDLVQSLFKDFQVVTYVSAHTHTGQFFVNGPPGSNWLELNLGSILDWSPEFRQFALSIGNDTPSQTASPRIELRTPQQKLADIWQSPIPAAPVADPAWEAKPGDPRYYLSYLDVGNLCVGLDPLCSQPLQRKLMSVELNEFKYSISTFRTLSSTKWPLQLTKPEDILAAIDAAIQSDNLDVMVPLAQALQDFDEVRVTADTPDGTTPGTKHHDYRLWQAFWASKRMRAQTRIPDSSEGYFTFSVGAR
jgi:hypothetical protein